MSLLALDKPPKSHYTIDMNSHSRVKLILGVLAALLILAALGRILAYEPRTRVTTAAKGGKQAPSVAAQTTPQSASKYEELIGAPVPTPAQTPARTQGVNPPNPPSREPVFITQKQPYTQPQTPRVAYPPRRYAADNGRVVDTNFYVPEHNTPSVPAAGENRAPSGHHARPQVSWDTAQTAMQEERAGRILAPYMRANRKDQDRMNAQWAKLSAAIDRAVAQALMPKSKKEALLEKYASKPSSIPADPVMQASGLTGAFAPVGQAIAAQKQEIIKNFAAAYGGSAARQAGSMMDAFAGELGAALNTPGLTQEQAAKRAQEIAKKYQDKMNALSEKSQYEKFMADRLAQDNQQKEALHNLYPDGPLSEQINGYIDTASQKLRELAAQRDLPAEEQNARYAQIEQDKRDGIQQAIVASGQSLNPFYTWEQKQNQEDLAKLKEKIEKGEIESVARPASKAETDRMRENVKVQREGLEKGLLADPRLGPQAVAEVKPILDTYENQLQQLYQQELSPDERQEQEVSLLKNVNRSLLQKRMEQVERMDLPDAQKQQALEELRQAYENIK